MENFSVSSVIVGPSVAGVHAPV